MSRNCMLNNISVYISEPLSRLPTELHNIVHVIQGHIGRYTDRDQYTVEQLSHMCTVTHSPSRSHIGAVYDRHETLLEVLYTSLPSLPLSFAATPIHQDIVVWEQLRTSVPRKDLPGRQLSVCVFHKSSLSWWKVVHRSIFLWEQLPACLIHLLLTTRVAGAYRRTTKHPIALSWSSTELAVDAKVQKAGVT